MLTGQVYNLPSILTSMHGKESKIAAGILFVIL